MFQTYVDCFNLVFSKSHDSILSVAALELRSLIEGSKVQK